MTQSGIFINYRREDTRGYALLLRDHLSGRFGQNRVFMDIGILGGQNWIVAIEQAITTSGAFLALIGPQWLTVKKAGRRRLDDPKDKLRQEIEAALELGIEVIPLLVGGADMPDEEQLPVTLRGLASLQGVRLDDEGWTDDANRLARRIEQIIGPALAPPAPLPTPTPTPPPPPSPVLRFVVSFVVLAIFGAAAFFIVRAIGDGGPPTGFDAHITVSPQSGPPGTIVKVTGTGFPPDSDVDIRLITAGAETRTDAEGNFESTIEVPDTEFTGDFEVIASSLAFSDRALFTIEG